MDKWIGISIGKGLGALKEKQLKIVGISVNFWEIFYFFAPLIS